MILLISPAAWFVLQDRATQILAGASAAAVIGVSGIMVLCCRVLLRFCGGISGFSKWILCKGCGEPVRGCNHIGGVPSTWHHRRTGLVYGPDGHRAEHP